MVLDPCEMCGRLCDYAECSFWGTCDECWFNVPTLKLPSRIVAQRKEVDDTDWTEILP